MTKTILKICVLIVVCANSSIAQNTYIENIDKNVEKILADFRVPGLAIAVVKDGNVICAKGYGIKEFNTNDKVDKNTVFPIASISKSTAALVLAMLVEENKLNWDDQIIKYLPDFQMYDEWVTKEITIRDILTHRSGLRSISGGTLWFGSDFSREEIVKRIKYLKPVTSFRSKYAYQNIMYLVAGQVINAVSGKTWDEFVKERIFTPLEMNNSYTTFEALFKHQNAAKPHILIDDEIQKIEYRNHDNIGPAASVVASVTDMANFLLLFLNEGKSGSTQLIEKQQLNELITPQMTLPFSKFSEEMEFANPTYRSYGLGWFIKDYVGYKTIYHSGGVDGFRCLVTMIPDKQLGFVVLTNQEERGAMHALTYSMMDAYLGFPELNWINYYLKKSKEAKEKRRMIEDLRNQQRENGTKCTFSLEKYCGKYLDRMYGDVNVELKNNKLFLSFSHTPSFKAELSHWQFDTFMINWLDPIIPDGLLTFTLDSEKNINEIKLDQPDLLDVDFNEIHLVKVKN